MTAASGGTLSIKCLTDLQSPPFFLLERDGKIMCQQELVNSLNQIYVSVNADIPPLDGNILLAFLPAEAGVLSVQPHEVFKKLLAIKPSKAHDPDHVPCRIVKEFAYELAEPITTIFNTSLRSGIVPVIWKESNIIPIPKIQPPMNEGDFRPISSTPCLFKVLEDFAVTWLIDDVKEKINPDQFGCLKGTSTTYRLLDMILPGLCTSTHPEDISAFAFLICPKLSIALGTMYYQRCFST